jgi:CBS domain-containing protein
MNPGWPIWLVLTLLLPLAARLLGNPRTVGGHRPRRAGAHFLHLAALAACALLASKAGGPSPDHPDWDRSAALVAMMGGMVWVEGALLLGLRGAHGATARRTAAGGGRAEATSAGPGRPESIPSRRADGPSSEDLPGAGAPLSAEAHALLERILRLDRVPVEQIMTPRERIVLADSAEPLASALRRMRLSGRSRLPVSAGSPDRILGVLHAKDLVPLALREERPASLRRHLRRYLHVPRGHSVARLLEDFRRHRVHIGIVTDPMGATLGLVTVTDVFRFIAGTEERGDRPAAAGEET